MSSDQRLIAKACSVYGCCKPAIANGFCDMHRKRLERHGDVLKTRPADWGLLDKHPLYASWRGFYRQKVNADSKWQDFWEFVKDVGERPSNNHRLSKIEKDKYLGPGNWYWRESTKTKEEKQSRAEYMLQYSRERRAADPWHEFRGALKRHYGITVEQYLEMYDSQGGACAICKNAETSVDPKTKKVRRLAVDHCHETGKVRGLLCSGCNTGLGSFKENLSAIKAAISYIESHKESALLLANV